MTQKEAIIKVLNDLGGRAKLADIYPRVIKMVYFKPDSDKQATIRTIMLRDPGIFRQKEKGSGWWELVSYQEEIVERDKEIAELKAEVERLQEVSTEDDFVKRFVEETKHFFKHDRKKADIVRQIMIKVGRSDADKELDAWIEGKEQKPSIAVAGNLVINKETNIDKNYGPNIENNGTLSLPDNK